MTIQTSPLSKLFNFLAPSRVDSLNQEMWAVASTVNGGIDEAKLWKRIQALLRAGAQIDARNKTGDTALHLLCDQRHLLAATQLIGSGADVTIVNNAGHTPFLTAARVGDPDLLKAFIAHKVDLTQCTPLKEDAVNMLVHALPLGRDRTKDRMEQRVAALKVLVDAGMKPDKGSSMRIYHHAPEYLPSVPDIAKVHDLKEAIESGDPQKAREIITGGVHPDATAEFGDQSALSFAAGIGDLGLIKTALDAGAKIDMISGDQRATPLQFAVVKGQRDAFVRLLELGANPDAPSARYFERPLFEAAQASGDPAMWKFVNGVLHERTREHLVLRSDISVRPIRLKKNDPAA